MPTRLILPGEIVESPSVDTSPGLEKYVTTQVLRAQVTPPAARGGRVEEHELDGALDSDLVEIEYENGVKQWVSVEQLRRDIERRGGERRSGGAELRVPASLQIGDASRGKATDWAVRLIRVIRSDPKDAAAELAANAIIDFVVIENFENKLLERPGLNRISPGFVLRENTSKLDDAAPYLLFLHGTASNTMGSFGGIVAGRNTGLSITPRETDEWKRIAGMYGDRILGFEHATLSKGPIRNAIELAEALPGGARLHLVSHSRGGLVGELMCMERPSNVDLDRMRQRGRDKDVNDLLELSRILAEKKFKAERFVRVACPARGTILASGRVDTYLTIIFNILKLFQPLAANPIFAFLEATIRETAKLRTDPARLPGLEAMMPESPLIRLLNTKSFTTDADLGVIAGDTEGEGVLGSLKVLATDLFYLEDHDLVVNTAAMYGGLRRKHDAFYFFDHGPSVSHFDYFGNAATRAKVAQWLGGGKEGFEKIERGTRALQVAKTRGSERNPVLILIPDFMASHLKGPNGRVWLDYDALASGGLESLAIESEGIQPDEVIGGGYERLAANLQSRYDVRPFAYDWRQSITVSAEALGKTLREHVNANRPVKLLAHGQGAAVALTLIARDPALWKDGTALGCRLVMLGAPLRGTFFALETITGRGGLARMLAMLDDGQTPNSERIFAGWPGLAEMLPDSSSLDTFSREFWGRTSARIAIAPEVLAEARRLRENINKVIRENRGSIAQVLGSAETVSGLHPGETDVFESIPAGDGRVLYEGNEIPDRTWYMDTAHGDLAGTESAFPALADLIESGTTARLPKTRPARAGAREPRPVRDERPLFPDEAALLETALCRSDRRATKMESWSLKVSVMHGNLRYANFPVAVGHYREDSIVHAEAELDRMFDMALSARHQMGIYPGPKGTVEVITRPKGSRPPGALIVGLGPVGEMTAEVVRQGIFDAALRHAMGILESRKESETTFSSAAFSSLLIGTEGKRAVGIEDSVTLVVQAALEANRALRAQGIWEKVRIDHVEFIELYEQRAVQAAHAVSSVGKRLGIALEEGESISPDPNLRYHPSGQLQPPANQYATGWWRRIEISGALERGNGQKPAEAEELRFKVLTDRARTEEVESTSQKALIDGLVERAISSPRFDPQLAVTLYELLVPNDLKDSSENRAHLLLEVDAVSARFPWEMMAERTAKDVRRLAVDAGMLRQFKTKAFRRAPRMSVQNAALVIGNPKLTDPNYPDLPGAREEAKTVDHVLRGGGFEVSLLTDRESLEIVTSLFARDYRIVHVAAHGEYDPLRRTGVVLGDRLFLGATEFGQMRVLPDLVFLNCCHLGQIAPETQVARMRGMNRLAASVAEQLINDGVKAVVVAGWAVNDGAASTFAQTLYEELLAGEKFGIAVMRARSQTCKGYRDSNTWAAYQCYGDPDFTLKARAKDGWEGPAVYHSRREYLDRAKNIATETNSADEDARGGLQKEIRAMEESLPEAWRDGEVLATIAQACAETGLFSDAVRLFELAIKDSRAGAPIRAIERLANIQDRHARALLQEAARAGSLEERTRLEVEALGLTNNAIERLEWLGGLGKTAERLSLMAGAYKRRGWVAKTDDERKEALEKSAGNYAAAWQLSPNEFYPALNWIAIRWLLKEPDPNPLLEVLEQAKVSVEADLKRPTDEQTIWMRVMKADLMLVEALIRGTLTTRLDDILREYRMATKGEGNWRNMASIRSQVELFRDHGPEDVRPLLERVIAALQI